MTLLNKNNNDKKLPIKNSLECHCSQRRFIRVNPSFYLVFSSFTVAQVANKKKMHTNQRMNEPDAENKWTMCME